MLKSLKLSGVGPAPEMQVDFGPRINVLTGDNGLGKSFLLDLAWWASTENWGPNPAWPRPEIEEPYIEFDSERRSARYEFNYFPTWAWRPIRSTNSVEPGPLAIFVRIDGSFCLYDPYRPGPGPLHAVTLEARDPKVFTFNNRQIWEGLEIGSRSVCEGVERDWVNWQVGRKPEFESLRQVLDILSAPDEKLQPAEPMRLDPSESFDRPTLQTATGVIPVALASAGVRRILALSYLLVWAVTEHRRAAELIRRNPISEMVFLFDEPETHLHPKWQRTILPSVLAAATELGHLKVQLITATHSPLVLASLEPTFDPAQDRLIDLHLDGTRIAVNEVAWRRRGDVNAWLTSEIFDLKSARSVEAEQALEDAAELLREEPPDHAKARELDRRLRGLLGELDPFWIRWRYLGEKQGWLE